MPSELNDKKRSTCERAFAIAGFFSERGLSPSLYTNQELASLSLTSTTLNHVVTPTLIQRAAKKLVTHVVLGEEAEARAMIIANPKLLLIKSTAVDYSGRTIEGENADGATAFQVAIGAGDYRMWAMMLPYLEREEALSQFNEWFPNGIEEDILASDLKPNYNVIIKAIIEDEDNGLSMIESFRQDLTAKKTITAGKHFNLQHLVAAYQAYLDNFDALGTWANHDLFWQKVIGFVQRQMTAFDAQIHCSGVKNVLDNPASFSRRLKFTNGGDFFPVREGAGMGFDFAVYSCYGGDVVAAGGGPPGAGRGPVLKNYVEQKQRHLQDLESHLSRKHAISRHSCVCS